jgi:hypothetical protein
LTDPQQKESGEFRGKGETFSGFFFNHNSALNSINIELQGESVHQCGWLRDSRVYEESTISDESLKEATLQA